MIFFQTPRHLAEKNSYKFVTQARHVRHLMVKFKSHQT